MLNRMPIALDQGKTLRRDQTLQKRFDFVTEG